MRPAKFQDELDFSEYAMYPLSCVEDSDGSSVVFEMYGEGHNQCSKKQVGTYKTSVQYFVKAYVKKKTQEAEISGAEYDVDEEALNYLYCTQFIYNNNNNNNNYYGGGGGGYYNEDAYRHESPLCGAAW